MILWPDADPPGRKAMETAAAALRPHRCRIVTLEAPGDDGSDAADLDAANIRARLDAVDWGAVAPAEHSPAMWIEGDPWSEWDEGTDAMAGRILRYYADRLLAVQFPGGYWQMFTAGAAGVWREDDALLRSWCDELARDWWASAGDLRTNTSIARAAQRWTTKRGQDDVLSEAGFGPAIEQLRRRNILPPDLTIAEHTQIDPTGRYVGCVNGVVDLDTGALVEGATARALFVTKAVAAFYRPELADDPNGAVYELLGRMSDDDRRWLLEAAGHALRGEPSRRVYLLQGPAGGGKSTILRALLAVVGEYGASLSETTLSSRAAEQTGRPTTELAPLGERRLVTLVEPQGTLAIGRLKKASGEDPITFRRHYARAEETRTGTATVFIAGNAGQIPRLPFEDDAVEERVRVLTVPAIPADERRAGLGKRFEEAGDVRDSLFALLVKHARKGSPPDDSPSVADARRALKREMIGPGGGGGEWLLTAIVPEPHGRVTTDQLWQAAKAAGGGDGDPWGLTRRRMRELVKSLHKLPPARRMKVAGKFSHGWRLASEDEVDAAIRELEPAADPKVIIIKHVAGDISIEMPSGNAALEPMRLPVHDRTRASWPTKW